MADQDFKYFAIKNWKKYQPDAKLRNKDAKLPWIKDYTDREDDRAFYSLTFFQRGVLEGLCRLAGRTPSRLLHNDPTYISQALHAHPKDRAHIPHALLTLTSQGFLVLCNEQIISKPDEISGGEGEGSGVPPLSESDPESDEVSKQVSKEEVPFAPLTTPTSEGGDEGISSIASGKTPKPDLSWMKDEIASTDWSTFDFTPGVDKELDEDANKLYTFWLENTGRFFIEDGAYSDFVAAKCLITTYGYEQVLEVLEDTLINNPNRKLEWTDFKVFARNFDLNQRKSNTYRRMVAAKEARTKVGA